MGIADNVYKSLLWDGMWVFDFSVVRELVGKHCRGMPKTKVYRKATNAVQSLRKKGLIKRVGAGLYALVPYRYVGKEFIADKFHVAQGLMNKIGGYCYVSHHSALELHGGATSVFNLVYITSEVPFRQLEYSGILFKRVAPSARWGEFEYYDREGMRICTSTKEVTFVDCIERLKYAGGVGEFARSILSFTGLDSKTVVEYALKHKNMSLNAKVGFFLTVLKYQSTGVSRLGRIRSRDIERLKNSLETEKVFYLDRDVRRGVYAEEWNLIVPNEIYALSPHNE